MRILKIVGFILLGLVVLLGAVFTALLVTAPGPSVVEGWELGPPLPSERGELASAVAHAEPCPTPPCPEAERLFVVGGLAGLVRVADEVAVFDPVRQAWALTDPLPAPRHHLGAAGLGEAVYVSGGAEGIGQPWEPEDNFWRLPVGANAWEILEPMPEPRWGHRLVAHEGRLYVVGGEGPSSRVLIYTPGEGWETGAAMPEPRDHLSAVSEEGRIWAMGGRTSENGRSLARVDIYDPEADRWEPGPTLPQATSGAAEGALGGTIYLSGGEEMRFLGGGVIDRHWRLDATAPGSEWVPALRPPLAIHGADGAVFQGTFVIVGGASRHGLLSVTSWTNSFQRLEPEVIPR